MPATVSEIFHIKMLRCWKGLDSEMLLTVDSLNLLLTFIVNAARNSVTRYEQLIYRYR